MNPEQSAEHVGVRSWTGRKFENTTSPANAAIPTFRGVADRDMGKRSKWAREIMFIRSCDPPSSPAEDLMLSNELLGQKTLNIASVSSAPDVPGLYAWYAEIRLGPPDWIEEIVNSTDLGEDRLRSALDSFSLFFARQQLVVEARSHFNVTWSGDLKEDVAKRLSHSDASPLAASLQSPAKRELLVNALASASPVFAHPLYIGVTDSLRRRLRDHSDEFFTLREAQRESPSSFIGYSSGQTFAQRAFRLGLREENLTVYYHPMELGTDLEPDAVRQTLESAEWLLNRWSTPLLGRK